jgi:hypothetical protein
MSDWKEEAACRDVEIEIFYDPGYESVATSYCSGCPVVELCFDEAMERPERFGVWGGFTAEERKELRNDTDTRDGATCDCGCGGTPGGSVDCYYS